MFLMSMRAKNSLCFREIHLETVGEAVVRASRFYPQRNTCAQVRALLGAGAGTSPKKLSPTLLVQLSSVRKAYASEAHFTSHPEDLGTWAYDPITASEPCRDVSLEGSGKDGPL